MLSTTEVFEREVPLLWAELERAARRYTRNSHDAEDLMQETMAKAWAGVESFEPGSSLRAWMHRIMINTWISAHRRSERRPQEWLTDSFTDVHLAAANGRIGNVPSAEERALEWWPDTDIRQAFEALPNNLQTAVYYVYVCQYPYKDIARMERIPVGTVMSRIHRARRQLRVSLSGVAQERLPHKELRVTSPRESLPTTANEKTLSMPIHLDRPGTNIAHRQARAATDIIRKEHGL
jgi:RNA polymerase sigma-70 factor, ECF subfamily